MSYCRRSSPLPKEGPLRRIPSRGLPTAILLWGSHPKKYCQRIVMFVLCYIYPRTFVLYFLLTHCCVGIMLYPRLHSSEQKPFEKRWFYPDRPTSICQNTVGRKYKIHEGHSKSNLANNTSTKYTRGKGIQKVIWKITMFQSRRGGQIFAQPQ